MNYPEFIIGGLRFDGQQLGLFESENLDQWTITDDDSVANGATFYTPAGSSISDVIAAMNDKIAEFEKAAATP